MGKRRKKPAGHGRGNAGQDADLECVARHEQVETRKSQAFDSPVSIRVDHYRCRLADPDGLSAKAAIDGLVNFGILRDDSAKEITEVRHFQHKVKNSDEEKTTVTIAVV